MKIFNLVIIFNLLISYQVSALEASDCRKKLESLICHTDQVMMNTGRLKDVFYNQDRRCLPDSKNYLGQIEKIFDTFPEVIQKLFCSFEKIFIEEKLARLSTGFAGKYFAKDLFGFPEWTGMTLYLSVKLFNEKTRFDNLKTSGLQKKFGFGEFLDLPNNKKLPKFNITIDTEISEEFLYTVLHELGHVFDKLNKIIEINRDHCQNYYNPRVNCNPKYLTKWTNSWDVFGKVKSESKYYLMDKICFGTDCSEYIDPKEANTVISSLLDSSFVSLYAGTKLLDDFAETFAYYLLHRYFNAEGNLVFNNGKKVNIFDRLYSQNGLKEKVEYLKNVLENTTLNYDVENL